MIPPLLFSYAEIHYHFRYLYPRYFRKEPEIIADLPFRITKPDKLPILIIIKDADKYPITLNSIAVYLKTEREIFRYIFPQNEKYSSAYEAKILYCRTDEIQANQDLRISVIINFTLQNGKSKTIINDNYKDSEYFPFRCYLSDKPLPYPENWFAGEPHYHSNYTNDQVEFGADINSTMIMAKALGLKWIFITDHSYDLDNLPNNYIEKDPNFTKWIALQKDVANIDSNKLRVISGEEVSIGNSKNENVHLLLINHPEYIAGSGDSAEKWFQNKPGQQINDIIDKKNKNNLFIAAHPFDEIPFLQKITLNRGYWRLKDLISNKIEYLQIINSSEPKSVKKRIYQWDKLLLQGHKFIALAGNDAHGNFNIMRQIKIPFLKLFHNRKQIFGKFQTVFHYKNNDPINGIKNKQIILSNGPFLNFWIENGDGNPSYIGSVYRLEQAILKFETRTTDEFGDIQSLEMIIGDIEKNKILREVLVKSNKSIDLPKKGFIRLELSTQNGGYAYTNPIWIEK